MDGVVEAAVSEFVAQDDVDERPVGKSVVEIDRVKAAAIRNPAALRQVSCLTDGHRGDIQPPHVHSAPGQPHGAESLAAGEIECQSRRRECVRVGGEGGGRPRGVGRRRSLPDVPLVPAAPILSGHSRHPTVRRPPGSIRANFWTAVCIRLPEPGWLAARRSERHLHASPILAAPRRMSCSVAALSVGYLLSYTGRVSSEVASSVSAPAGAARRSDRRPGQTIRKVLDAGLAELRDSSYANLTMRAVAGRAGVSPASAYTYFPSKSALVAAVYLRFLRELPLHTDVNETTKIRVSATLRDMAVAVSDEPELTIACGTALMADDPAVSPLREEIGEEVARRIAAALGPGWPRAVKSTLQVTFAGALMTARFVSYEEIAGQLDDAVNLILGASVA